jgi:methylated-DNA-[protein]-cysteine S-methyltransferase
MMKQMPTIEIDDDLRETARRLGEATSARAHREGLVDVGYSFVDTPLGRLMIACTRRGLVRLEFPDADPDHVLEELAGSLSPRVLEDPKRTEGARRQLDAYFEGRVRRFRTPLDWSLAAEGFSRRVLEATAAIPFGAVSTYREVAGRAGSPRAARAAGNALHDNPLPIVVPCHRVVGASGALTGYGGGLEVKRALLALEAGLV